MESLITGVYRKRFYRDPVNCKFVLKTEKTDSTNTLKTPWDIVQSVINEFCDKIIKINVEQRHQAERIVAVIETNKFNFKRDEKELKKWLDEHQNEISEFKIFCDESNLNKYFS